MKKAMPWLVFSAFLLLTASPAQGRQLQIQTIATGLKMPTSITYAPDGSGRLFVTLQAGTVVILNGNPAPATFLDISSLVLCCGERGLLGLAFHPNYAVNGIFFVYYSDVNGNSTVARYHVSANPDVANPASAQVILNVQQPPYPNHKGGQLRFGPDGYLYIGLGDGGSGGDPGNRAQDLTTLLGKILRINVDGQSTYSIPANNPFVANPSVRPEIWAYGLRNPWRFSFDRLTGDLLIADVGQDKWEEVDVQPASSTGGENYGWRLMEGKYCYNPAVNCNPGGLVMPVFEYNHAAGCAIIGGYAYRGSNIPALAGSYLYGDFCSGQIWGATQTGGVWQSTQLLASPYSITTFGEDQNGELYFADFSGQGIFKIVGLDAPYLAADLGPQGLWVYHNGAWKQLTASSPDKMATYGQKLVASFAGVGIYEYDGTNFTLISSNGSIRNMVGAKKIYVDTGAGGLWQWDGAWTLLTPGSPVDLAASGTRLYANFSPYGLWQWDGGSWTRIDVNHPVSMAVWGRNLYANYGIYGLWQWDGAGWTRISAAPGQDTVPGGFAINVNFYPYGLWQWDGGSWTRIDVNQPVSMAASGTNLYANYGVYGLWQWNGANWRWLTPSTPTDLAASGANLYSNFGALGIWQWDGNTWTMLSASNARKIIATGN